MACASYPPLLPPTRNVGVLPRKIATPGVRRVSDCAILFLTALLSASAGAYLFSGEGQSIGAFVGTSTSLGAGSLAAEGGDAVAAAACRQQRQQQQEQRQQAQQRQQQQCDLGIQGGLWGVHCQRLHRVCVDQQQLIFYEPRYQVGAEHEPAALPTISVHRTRLYHWPWREAGTDGSGGSSSGGADFGSAQPGAGGAAGSEEEEEEDEWDEEEGEEGPAVEAGVDGSGGNREAASGSEGSIVRRRMLLHQTQEQRQPRRMAYELKPKGQHFERRPLLPIPTRPASGLEPAPYLAAPAFSTCTVPIVFYPIFPDNFAHFFHDVAAFLHSLLRRTPWRQHAKLVVVTPDGLAMTQPEAQLLPVLSNVSVQTWADFSRRLPPGYDPRADRQQQPPPSFEGGEQRCFETLYVCGRRFRPSTPLKDGFPKTPEQEDKQLRRSVPRENFGFGQEVVQWYSQHRPAAMAAPATAGAAGAAGSSRGGQPTGSRGTRSSSSSGSSSNGGTAGGRRLRVRFMRRDSGGRQLLNAEELLDSCNFWKFTPPGGGSAVTADCRQVELPNLEAGIAAAQEADVFIGMHGANMANSFLMRPGSSTIEITPYEFGKMKGAFGPCIQNAQDASSQLLWWQVVVCDPSLSTPGPDEVAGREPSRWWPRDRNSRVPWRVLATVLEELVSLGGDRQRYLQDYFVPSRHRLHFTAKGVVSRADQPLCTGA